MVPVFLTASIIGAQMISSPFSPDIGSVRIALMRWLEIISNRFHQSPVEIWSNSGSRLQPFLPLRVSTFLQGPGIHNSLFVTSGSEVKVWWVQRRPPWYFGALYTNPPTSTRILLYLVLHHCTVLHEVTHHYRAKKQERACFLILGPKLQEIDSLNVKEPNAV